MGIGVWYEMQISNPISFLYKNSDPQGSLAANVSNATVRCLSNMKLADMLENRHEMSRTVRDEVSAKSQEWGYKLGSVYVRKVHFRDAAMMRQIEEKVVNRLRQVTAAIRQDGTNQVSLITGQAERTAAIEFAKATAMRPQIIGEALREISADPEICEVLFEVLETQAVVDNSGAGVAFLPQGAEMLAQIIGARAARLPPGP
jgi:regulator of protease activity HflC (stomatin/prohibitin superfamily)